jgi:GrpB-like predicted nucleotidyltransferase (UPF0157 family)
VPGFPVDLRPYDAAWAGAAQQESARLLKQLGGRIVVVHHIGSTSIPGIHAKPILDLLPVVDELARLDDARQAVEALGYEWLGEFGLAGRRYCRLDDPFTGQRRVHCIATRSDHPKSQGIWPFVTTSAAIRPWLSNTTS